ncbi:MAG TPA: hypothetical protein DDW42_03750 [Desulfobacteraceae bacterium]|nr:hypothetical protein [Desulfobacteraceae bacterium]
MRTVNSGRIQDKLINRLDRQKRNRAFDRDRLFKFKLPEIHNKLSQALFMEKVIETDNPGAVSDALLTGLKKAQRSSEFDFNYFIAPVRNLVPRPNIYSLYITQYILEFLINDPNVIEVYGTDEEIYKIVEKIFSQASMKFEKEEREVVAQLAHNKSLVPGSRDYEIALEELMRKKVGEPQKVSSH